MVVGLLLASACRMDNPGFKFFDSGSLRDCEVQASGDCEQPRDESTSDTRGDGTDSDEATSSDTTQLEPSTAVRDESSSDSPSSTDPGPQSSTGGTSTGDSSTSHLDTLPEYPIGCDEDHVNCYSMKYDGSSKSFVARGSGSIRLGLAQANAALRLRTESVQGPFGHSWWTDGTGYGLLSSEFSLSDFDGIGFEMMLRGLSCPGQGVCLFAAFDGVLAMGYRPEDNSLICRSYHGLEVTHNIGAVGAEVRVACSLRDGLLQIRLNRSDTSKNNVEVSGVIERQSTALILGPTVTPTVDATDGVSVEVGWIRIWHSGTALENSTSG